MKALINLLAVEVLMVVVLVYMPASSKSYI